MIAHRRLVSRWLLALAPALAGCGGGAHRAETTPPPAASDVRSVDSTGVVTGRTAEQIATGYQYRFRMISPANDNNAITEREVYLWFWPDTSRVWFRLENRIGTPIKVLWDDIRFTTTDGQSFRTIHEGVTFDRRYQPQDFTQVYGLQRYNGWIAPVDILEDPSAAQGTGMRPLFPTDNSAPGFLNKIFRVDFVLEIEGQPRTYPLAFKIDSVLPPG